MASRSSSASRLSIWQMIVVFWFRIVHKLARVDAAKASVRPTEDHAALAKRRVFRRIHDSLSLSGAFDVQGHDSQCTSIKRTGDKVILDLRDAHKRGDGGGLKPGHQIGDLVGAKASVLHVHDHKIEASHLKQLRKAARSKLKHHVPDRHLAFRANLFEAV